MKTWTMELTENELIALAKICTDWQESKLATRHMTVEDLLTLHLASAISQKYPEEDRFSDEVKV